MLECLRETNEDERRPKYALVRNPGDNSLVDLLYSVRQIGRAIENSEGDPDATQGLAGALLIIGTQLEGLITDVHESNVVAAIRASGAV